jgi:hypothetical protein
VVRQAGNEDDPLRATICDHCGKTKREHSEGIAMADFIMGRSESVKSDPQPWIAFSLNKHRLEFCSRQCARAALEYVLNEAEKGENK